jgi:DNA repair exonuclease SbcCD ATPase subunit
VETKDEEIVMLRAVLAQHQGGNSLGASVSMSHLMRGSSNIALPQQKMAWGANSSHTLLAQSSADSLPLSLSETKESTSNKQEMSLTDISNKHEMSLTDASCQTVETVFGHCDVCADSAKSLVDVQNIVVHISQKYSLTSRLTSQKAKWLKAGVMSTAGIQKWTSSCVTDLEAVDAFISEALAKETSVKMELQSKEKTLNGTVQQIDDLQLKIEQLESDMNEIQNDHNSQLLSIQQEFTGKEKELEVLNKTLEDQLKEIRANEQTLEATLEEHRASCHNLGDSFYSFIVFIVLFCVLICRG